MTKNIACRYADASIPCNAIAPGTTPTALNTPDKSAIFDPFAEVRACHVNEKGARRPLIKRDGGDEGIRTLGPHVANVMLSQLSYIPIGENGL